MEEASFSYCIVFLVFVNNLSLLSIQKIYAQEGMNVQWINLMNDEMIELLITLLNTNLTRSQIYDKLSQAHTVAGIQCDGSWSDKFASFFTWWNANILTIDLQSRPAPTNSKAAIWASQLNRCRDEDQEWIDLKTYEWKNNWAWFPCCSFLNFIVFLLLFFWFCLKRGGIFSIKWSSLGCLFFAYSKFFVFYLEKSWDELRESSKQTFLKQHRKIP